MIAFNVEIVSDTVCPWCYIGSKRLHSAIEKYKQLYPERNDTFNITWLPYYLNPDAPKKGIDKPNYYRSKFGDERTRMIFGRLMALGQQEGISFKFGGRTGNTRDSHRLIHMAGTQSRELQSRLVNELFVAYFEAELDITDWEMLIDAAARAGIDAHLARSWLETGAGGREIDAEVAAAKNQQINGVPNFLIQEKYEIGGAQDAETFLKVFDKILTDEKAAA